MYMAVRRGFIALSSIKPLVKDGKKYCLNCEKPIAKGSRRKKYCSYQCSYDFFAKHNWQILREKTLIKMGHKCEKCGAGGNLDEPLIVDHKEAIRLGGAEFDENNLQILCSKCNKIKTAKDMKKIAKLRKDEKIMVDNQKNLKWERLNGR
jgi:5-methylcytosine-specific restriction endonuclease McrA